MTDRSIKITRRRLLGGLISVGAIGAASGAGTMAAFSDSESSNENSIQAGTLELGFGSSSTFSFNTDLAPTETTSDTVTLVRSGTLSGSLDIDVSYVEDDATGNNANRSADELAENLEVTRLEYGGQDITGQISTTNSPPTLFDLANNDQSTEESSPNDIIDLSDPGVGTDFTVEFRLKDVNNPFQNDGVAITFTFYLNQTNGQ